MPARPYHHGDLRAALLAAAEKTLRERGSTALSLRELAREIGVSHGAPGRHFKDKQALLDALALTGYERMAQVLESADAPGAPLEERLTALARAYLAFAIDNDELLNVMYARKHDPDVSVQLAAAVDRTVGALVRLFAEAQERGEIVPGDPEQIALVASASLHGIAAFTLNGSVTPQAALAFPEELIHHLLHGLTPRRP